MKNPIYIFGAGGLGREVRVLISRIPEWQTAGFYDDAIPKGTIVDGITCLGGIVELLGANKKLEVVIAIGDPTVKRSIVDKLKDARHLSFPALIDPAALLLDPDRIAIGDGTILTAGCILTTGISLGNHCLINLNVTVGHDVQMGTACSIMPGANLAGNVKLGSGVLVGSGANLLNGIRAGDGSRIGAGAVVLHDVPPHTTVMGVPAKERK